MHLVVIPQGHFWTEAPFGYLGQNFNITANEDLMPQDHPWTEASFGYPSQNLEILDTTANEDINVQNILIGMHDSVLQIKNSLQDSMQKFKNIQKIMQGINISFAGMNEKFSKLESQSSAPKVVVQKKYGHSYVTKPKRSSNL